jgi:hypothetical protein
VFRDTRELPRALPVQHVTFVCARVCVCVHAATIPHRTPMPFPRGPAEDYRHEHADARFWQGNQTPLGTDGMPITLMTASRPLGTGRGQHPADKESAIFTHCSQQQTHGQTKMMSSGITYRTLPATLCFANQQLHQRLSLFLHGV